MPEPRRPRAATAEKRTRILDAAERLMLEEGYAAVTSRRVEAESGLKLHYHFGSVDELFTAMVRRRGEAARDQLAEALRAPEPLRAWWKLASDRRGNGLLVEMTAAGNHRPALQSELGALARDVRRMQIEVLEEILDDYGIDRDLFPPALFAAAFQGLGFVMAHDQVAGYETAQEEATKAVARLLDTLEGRRADARR